MRRLVAIGLVSAVLALGGAAVPAYACGCGVVAPPAGSTATTYDERAIISKVGGVETIELTFGVASDVATVGLLIPTPSAAEVTVGDARTFDLLENVTRPSVHEQADFWGVGYFARKPARFDAIEQDRVTLKPLTLSTMAPGDAKSQAAWLKKNGFEASPEALAAMASYAGQGWSITAVRIETAKSLSGHIDPIRLSFHTSQLVYPLRFARADTAPRTLRLYVFDSTRSFLASATQRTLDLEAPVTTRWAGATPDPRLVALGPYLTVLDVDLTSPATQASSDVGVIPSAVTGDLQQSSVRYRTVTLLGMPVGTLIVGWLLLGIIFAIALGVRRHRAR